jgi:hypothetical protein
MVRVELSRNMKADAASVFDFVVNQHAQNFRRWSPAALLMEQISSGPVGLDSTFRQRRKDMGQEYESEHRVTRFEAGREFVTESLRGRSSYRNTYTFKDASDGSSSLRILRELDGVVPRPFEGFARRGMQAELTADLDRLQEIVEALDRARA